MDLREALLDKKNDTREFYSDDWWNSDLEDDDAVFGSLYYDSDDYDDPYQKNYTILKKDDLRKIQDDDITRVFSSALSISKADTESMKLHHMNENFFSNLTSYEDKMNYSFYLNKYYNRWITWCPSPGCDCAIEFHSESKSCDVTCSCSYTFCWNCMTEVHRPLDCETVFKWIMENYTVYDNMKSMMNLKVEEMEKKSLEKYTHYYVQWARQELLRQKALADLKEVKELHLARISLKWQNELPLKGWHRFWQIVLPLKDWHRLIVEAWLQIVECRRVLKWSYVYGYYYMCEEEHKRKFFEYLQGQAEEVLENLHQCADKDFHAYLDSDDASRDDFNNFRYKLDGLTSIARKHFERLVRALEKGLFDVDTHGATSKGKRPTKGDDVTFYDDDLSWDY